MIEQHITPEDAAQLLAVSTSTVYNLIARHEIKVTTVGRSRRIVLSDLQRWIEEHSRGGARSGGSEL